MKKLNKYIAILFLIVVSFSCRNDNVDKKNIDELALIEKLSQNNFYKDFFHYNIRPREQGCVYMIETDSIKEFWVDYHKDSRVTFFKDSEKDLEEKLKMIYPNEYLKIKKTYISDLNKLIPFMIINGIESTLHVKEERLDFYLLNNNEIRWYERSFLNEGVESLKKYYGDVTIVDSNWVILKNERLP